MLVVNNLYLFLLILGILILVLIYLFKNIKEIRFSIKLIISLFIIFGSGIMYYYSGGMEEIYKLNQMQDTQKMVYSIISRLEQVVSENQEDAKGWYLLGKLYLKINKEQEARYAFEQAYRLEKDKEKRKNLEQLLFLTNKT